MANGRSRLTKNLGVKKTLIVLSLSGLLIGIVLLGSRELHDPVPEQAHEWQWQSGPAVEARFADEFFRSRRWSTDELLHFARLFRQREQVQPLEQPKGKTSADLFRELAGTTLVSLELPFQGFFDGEVSPNTGRYLVNVIAEKSQLGDGGQLTLRVLLSMKISEQLGLSSMQKENRARTVRILLSPYHPDLQQVVESIRAPVWQGALNSHVQQIAADVIIAADLLGIALVGEANQIISAVMKAAPKAPAVELAK